MDDVPRLRYFVIDSTTGLTFYNFFDEGDAMEACMRMKGDYHIGRGFVGTPLPFKEGEHHG